MKKEEVIFISSNGFDVVGAKGFGFKVSWLQRGGGPSLPVNPLAPAQMYRLLRTPNNLGYAQDDVVSALTDLPGLL